MPQVSVIVVSYNRAADLRLALAAVRRSSHRDVELIVVDNASSDEAAEVAASFSPAHLIRNESNLGFAQANNQGLERARGEFIVLLNNDAVIEEQWIERHVEFLEQHAEAAAVGSKLYFWDDDHPLGDRGNPYYGFCRVDPTSCLSQTEVSPPDEVREVASLSGAAVVIRRRAIDDVGPPFLEPEFFTYYEETDFFARALRRGWRLYYTGEPAAWHRVRASTSRQPYRYFFYMERNRLLFAHRNLPEGLLRHLVRQTRRRAVRELASQPWRFLSGEDDEARARRDAWWWALRNRQLLATHRHKAAGGKLAYDEAVTQVDSRAQYYGHPRPEVAALVPADAQTVIDVGCGAGALGQALKASRPGLQVYGVEPAAEPARRARQVLDDVLEGRAADPLPPSWPAPDCVVFADVLEHTRDPWSVLALWRKRLAPGGSVVLSLPNVAHRSVVHGLLRGRWQYEDAGILDRTHLRFFTRRSARALVERAGLRVVRFERVLDEDAHRGWRARLTRLAAPAGDDGWRARPADLHTVQFLLVAR